MPESPPSPDAAVPDDYVDSPILKILDAAEHGDVAKVRQLLERDPALVNAAAEYARTPLHWAAENNNADLAQLLLEHGAVIDATTTWGATPLEWAGYLGSVAVGELLLTRGAAGMNLVVAAGLGKLDTVREFCEQNESLDGLGIPARKNDHADKTGWPPDAARMQGDVLGEAFQVACRNGHLEVAQYLLDRGADVDAKGYFGGTGLHWAALNGHEHIVRFLLDRGANASLRDHGFDATPDGWAAEGDHDSIAMLIKNHRDGGGLVIEH